MKTPLHQLPNPAEHLPNAPISVRHWKAILSPAQMARYAFNAYDALLSLTALQTMQNHDAATAGAYGRERATYDNLRTAMARLYEASTVDLLLSGGILSVHLCVPGGSLSHWPVHIPKPAGAQLSQLSEVPEEEEEDGEPEADDLSGTGGDAVPFTDEELSDLDPEKDNFNPPNELAYEHYT